MSVAWLVVAAALDAPLAPLGLEEVLGSAQAHFPAIVAAQADVEAADGERLAAAGAFDPAWRTRFTGVPVSGYPQLRVDSVVEVPTPLWGASLFAGWRLGAGKLQPYYGERETWSAGELRAGAAIPLLRNGPVDRRRTNEARAALGQSLAGLSVEQQRLEVTRAATVRWAEWVAAGRRWEVARALLQLAKDRDQQLGTRAGLGDVARFDRQDNARSLVQREAVVVQARRGVEQAGLELSLFLRDEAGRPVVPAPTRLPSLEDPRPPPASVALEAAVARRPDVRRLEDQRRQAELEETLGKNQLLPALDVGVAVSKDLGAAGRPDAEALGPVELELGATLEVPLLLRAPLGRLKAARAQLAKVDAQLRLERERVRVEVEDARSALQAAQGRLQLARAEVALAQDVEVGERKRFELGEGSLLFVNLREQTTAEARLREVDAALDGHRAWAALEAALGGASR